MLKLYREGNGSLGKVFLWTADGIFLCLNVTLCWRSPRQWDRVRAHFGSLCLVPEGLNFFSSEPGTKSHCLVTWERVVWSKKESILEGCYEENANLSGLCFLSCNSTFCPVRGHQVPGISATPQCCRAVRVQFWDPTPTLAVTWLFQHFVTLKYKVKPIKLSRKILKIPNSSFAGIKQRPEDIKRSVIPAP